MLRDVPELHRDNAPRKNEPGRRGPILGRERQAWRGGSRHVFRHFAWLEVCSDKIALSLPTYQRVTQTVAVGLPMLK
jgi:hypothetical protein